MKSIFCLCLLCAFMLSFMPDCIAQLPTETTAVPNDSSLSEWYINFLFTEHSIEQIVHLAPDGGNDPNSFGGKFLAVQKLVKEKKADEAKRMLRRIAANNEGEARATLWAWNGLRELGEMPATPKVLGLVLEVPMPGGTEYLAVYADKRARYINYTGAIAVWETTEKKMDKVIGGIISKSQQLVANEKLDKGRSSSPTDKVRFNFLTTAGILRTEESINNLMPKQSSYSDIFQSATEALVLIVEASEKK